MASKNIKVNTCVTSPPYFGLRDYGHSGQLGLEKTPEEYIENLVDVFRGVRDVLRDDGTLWLNLGDSYGKGKQLQGMPWRVALALQSDGWVLRQDIIWHKTNPMPESVTDRCTKSHEYIFLFSKSKRYYFDSKAIKEPQVTKKTATYRGTSGVHAYNAASGGHRDKSGSYGDGETRNKRSVWSVTSRPYKGAHFATFPPDLITPCVLAGCPTDGIVLDPFMGSGTTAAVALTHGRQYIGCELNESYRDLQELRIANV